LEAAPTSGTAAWTDSGYVWSYRTTIAIGINARGLVIGTGYKNTEAIVTQNAGVAFGAGALTRGYRGPNNLSDWYLPAASELQALYNERTTVGGFSTDGYWSSSEMGATTASAWDFYFGSPNAQSKNLSFKVRPVRAFGGTLACADGGVCAVGDTGPGGGKVFYVSSSNFTSTGSVCGTACKYLEAAPSDHSSQVAWCSNTSSSLGVTGTGIGSGMSNTTTADSTCTSGAIQVAADYTNNSKTDWHLPSKDELAQLYAQRTTVGSFSTSYYWSSSEDNSNNAWFNYIPSGYQNTNSKNNTYYVRPVRAFG
jgi:hypothetical protein